jgi:YesN/AraC family two-component response regulator
MSIGTVLIVDDEPMMRDVVIEMLKDRAEKIIPAKNGEEALSLLRGTDEIDVVITDMKMPGMTGVQLLETVKMTNPCIPVIVMTGYSETFGLERIIKKGAEEYILKPFRKAEINMIVNKAIWRMSAFENKNRRNHQE